MSLVLLAALEPRRLRPRLRHLFQASQVRGSKRKKGDPLCLISGIITQLASINYVELGERWIFLCGEEGLRVFAKGKESFEGDRPLTISIGATFFTSANNDNNDETNDTWTLAEDFSSLTPGQLVLRIPAENIQYSRWSASLGPQPYRPHCQWGSEIVRQEVIWDEEMAEKSEESVNVNMVDSPVWSRIRKRNQGRHRLEVRIGDGGHQEDEGGEMEQNGLGMMIKRRRRMFDEFGAAHISPCQNHLALILSSSRLLFIPHFERLTKAEEDLWDIGVDVQLGSVRCPSVYLSYGCGEAQGGGSAGKIGAATMSDTGVGVNYDTPEPPRIEGDEDEIEAKGKDNMETGKGENGMDRATTFGDGDQSGSWRESKFQKPPLSYHTPGKARRWTSQQFPLGTTPPSQLKVRGGKCKWNDAEDSSRKRMWEFMMERGATLDDGRFTITLDEKRIDKHGMGSPGLVSKHFDALFKDPLNESVIWRNACVIHGLIGFARPCETSSPSNTTQPQAVQEGKVGSEPPRREWGRWREWAEKLTGLGGLKGEATDVVWSDVLDLCSSQSFIGLSTDVNWKAFFKRRLEIHHAFIGQLPSDIICYKNIDSSSDPDPNDGDSYLSKIRRIYEALIRIQGERKKRPPLRPVRTWASVASFDTVPETSDEEEGTADPSETALTDTLLSRFIHTLYQLLPTNESVHRIKVDERNGFFLTTSRVGGLVVRDMESKKVLWELPKSYVRPYAHLEYENGYIIFDRLDGAKEVWRSSSIPSQPPSTLVFQPDDRQHLASALTTPLLTSIDSDPNAYIRRIAEIPPLAGVMSASGLPPSGEVSVRLRVEDEDALIDEEHHILGANAHATPHSTPQPGAVGSSSGGASSKEKGKGKEKATVQEEEDPTFPTFKPFKTGWWDTNSTFSGNAFNSSRATTKSSQGGKKRKGDPLALISNISMLLGGLNYVELGERWIFLCGQESLRVFARGKEFFECEGEDAHPSGSMSTPSTSSTSTSNQNHRSDAISNSASTSTSGDSAPTIIGRKPYLWTPEDFKTLPPGQLALRIPCDKIQYSRWSASLGPQSYRPHWGSEVVRQEVVWTEEMAGESEDSVNVGLVPSSAGGRMRQDDSWETHGLQATRNVFGGWGNPGWGYYDEEEEEEEEEEEREENGLGMMIKRRRRLYDEFVAVHISPCQNHLALLLSSSRLLFVPHFERLIKAEEDLWDVGVDLQLGSVGCPSVYLSYGSGEAQGGGSAGRVGVVTQQGIYIITPYLRQPFENSASPSFTRPVELIVMRLAPSFLDPRRLIDVSCLQMSDTGVWVNYDAPEPPKIEARINGLEFKGNDNLEKGEGKSKKVKKKKGNGMKSKSQKPPLSYHTAGKAHRWTSQQFPLGTTPPSQFQVQGGKCKWNDAEITWRKRRLEMSMERGATLHDDRFTKTLNEKRIDENGTGGHAVHELPNGDMVALPEDITGDRLTWIQQMRAKSEAHQIRFIPYEY
ncbi:hypothetical protein EST38_g7514 [Candolleomyces aberdarensis]|uniref:Uncharacterized protein n=1 Tax=Candolleomyces aberdarensis TaxID=2316362 RepID=A0A4Q2DEZ1_9AGAR|nr:hypothetical protein EST38_g7514 [Candolleomyces aberdarensis]